MSKQLTITIPEPCHEGWEKMTPSEKGRFCGACQKQVVDFTKMSDSQMVAFFKQKSNRSVCGHFEKDQLDRDIDIPKKRIPWVKYFFQFVIPAFLATRASAQSQQPSTILRDSITATTDNNLRGKVCIGPENTISGRVVDKEGNGVPNVAISIVASAANAVTDSLGNFNISYKGGLRKVTIIAAGRGYIVQQTKKIRLKKRWPHVGGVQFVVTLVPKRDTGVEYREGFIGIRIQKK